jgi:hypothetical protein
MSDAWINYDEEAESEPRDKWRHSDLKSYWREQHATRYETFGKWGIKETSLLSKLLAQYKATDLADMVDYWFQTAPQAHSFGAFFNQSETTFEAVKKDRGNWEW